MIFFLDVTGSTHIIIEKSWGYIVMGMSVPYTTYGVPIPYMLLLLRGKGWASPGHQVIFT
jgi:hypothetical protein